MVHRFFHLGQRGGGGGALQEFGQGAKLALSHFGRDSEVFSRPAAGGWAAGRYGEAANALGAARQMMSFVVGRAQPPGEAPALPGNADVALFVQGNPATPDAAALAARLAALPPGGGAGTAFVVSRLHARRGFGRAPAAAAAGASAAAAPQPPPRPHLLVDTEFDWAAELRSRLAGRAYSGGQRSPLPSRDNHPGGPLDTPAAGPDYSPAAWALPRLAARFGPPRGAAAALRRLGALPPASQPQLGEGATLWVVSGGARAQVDWSHQPHEAALAATGEAPTPPDPLPGGLGAALFAWIAPTLKDREAGECVRRGGFATPFPFQSVPKE